MPAAHNYWPLVLQDLKESLTAINFQTWISKIQFNGVVGSKGVNQVVSLSVPSVFCRNYIQKKFYNQLQTSLRKYYPNVTEISISVDESLEPVVVGAEESIQQSLIQEVSASDEVTDNKSSISLMKILSDPASKYQGVETKLVHSLNSKYTFDNFVICGSNQLAAMAANTVAKHPGMEYNPLFIYGGVGLGKTHLMQAVGHKILENNPNFKIKYISAETFINEFLFAMQKNKMADFKAFYRSLDVLLVDDVQFLAGKEATQEEFFHTFNELHQQNKQIILTSDRAPKDIPAVEARLVSRFGWGMVVDISEPDFESRVAILQHKARRRGINLKSDVVEFVAEKVVSNVRDLEGVLNKILMHSTSLGVDQSISFDIVQKCIGEDFLKQNEKNYFKSKKTIVSPQTIIEVVAEYYSLQVSDITGVSRSKEIMKGRQVCMWLMKNELKLSLPAIGRIFGGKDHTTVLHGCRKIDELISNDPSFGGEIESIQAVLKN